MAEFFSLCEASEKSVALKDFQEFSPGAMAEFFSLCEALINICLLFSKSFHPFPVKNHQHFHSQKLLRKIRASKDFWLHPDKNFDIIKTVGGRLPIRMTFYSTKIV